MHSKVKILKLYDRIFKILFYIHLGKKQIQGNIIICEVEFC